MIVYSAVKAIRTVLGNRDYLLLFSICIIVTFSTMIYLPVRLTPGNDLLFQLKLFTPSNYLLFAFLSLLASLVITFEVYIFRRSRMQHWGGAVPNSMVGGAGLVSGIVSSLFATATCAACLSALFGFLGVGSVFFIVQNKFYFTLGSLILLLLSLYFSTKRLTRECPECRI